MDQISTYLRGVWIKKRYIIISSWLLCPIGWSFVATMPDQYESSARLFVDTNSLLRPLLRGLAVSGNPSEQVNIIARTLLSKPNLEKIAREADLDITVNSQAEMDSLTSQLKDNIKLETTRERNIYTIRYDSDSPEIAQRIVQVTLNEFVESSLGSNRQDSDSAQEFLNQQIEEYEQRLEQAEQRVAAFKLSRIDRAPGSTDSYYAELQRETERLEQTELKLLELESQLAAARSRLVGEEPVFGLFQASESNSSESVSTKYDSRIANLESKKDELLIQYTENHPDVVKIDSLIKTLNGERDKLIQNMSETAKNTGSYSQFGNLNQNPVYQEMKLAVAQYENQIASLKVRAEKFKAKVSELKKIIDLVPQIEAEAQGLNRDYEITRQKYRDLLSRREQAELSRKAGATADDVKFKVIDPPSLPTKPSGPHRILFYTMILFLGFGVGIGVALLVSQLSPVVLSASQLKNTFGIPILGQVSHTDLSNVMASERRNMLIFVISSACVLILYAGLVWADIAFGRLPLFGG